jgi:hypothetical protein
MIVRWDRSALEPDMNYSTEKTCMGVISTDLLFTRFGAVSMVPSFVEADILSAAHDICYLIAI